LAGHNAGSTVQQFLQGLKYLVALLLSPAIGSVLGIPFAFVIDVVWGHPVTGGRWPLTTPNVMLSIIQASFMGFSAGWIAGKRGKLIAGLADFTYFSLILIAALMINRDLFSQKSMDTQQSLWVYVGFFPAILMGHLAVKYKHLGLGAILTAVASVALALFYIGATIFHVYTATVALDIYGIGAAMLVFLIPIFSEIYWFFKAWYLADTVWNVYTVRMMVLLVWGIAAMIVVVIGTNLDERRKKREVQAGALAPAGAD
jgi:hypothetical protein